MLLVILVLLKDILLILLLWYGYYPTLINGLDRVFIASLKSKAKRISVALLATSIKFVGLLSQYASGSVPVFTSHDGYVALERVGIRSLV